jgi:hypothetical protein
MNRITYNSFNGKFFYEMTKPELEYCMEVIKAQIDAYRPSISGICISDQEAQQERWNAWQNANYNLNKLLEGEKNVY